LELAAQVVVTLKKMSCCAQPPPSSQACVDVWPQGSSVKIVGVVSAASWSPLTNRYCAVDELFVL